MFSNDQYRLIDFGAGRRLERFGALLLDRPCPSADGVRRANPSLWNDADARFIEQNSSLKRGRSDALGFRGIWQAATELGRQIFDVGETVDQAQGQSVDALSSRPWTISYRDRFSFELKGSPFGHLGVFPEQAENWDRIFDLCREGAAAVGRPLRILNLFGYTGGSALAAVAAGADATHLDAARNIVAQARRNAALSFPGLVETSDAVDSERNGVGKIRWIVDDAVKFVKREIKRNVFYDGVILDPPTYGHGARGEVWRLSRDLEPFLQRLAELLPDTFSFVLLTCHTPSFEGPALERLLRKTFRERFGTDANVRRLTKPLEIASEKNGALPAGDLSLFARR